ncbi:receptor-type tyrosine-protein phosphatase epsilon-like [Pecten maximus]|uniref:receptor-type tyrosine-protein phosphatase epsilon-like n=1 Tax=Pecten maximus TaxID=6579 RepID=UPI0014583F36|nr:receptor-type tyrosine-protein phosphatase epsilon-like [Pecten maximus]
MVMGCPIHKHGDNCMENCPQNCYENMCFPRNGTCMKGCLPGYKGSTCQEECPDYHYGARCASECNCKEGPCNVRSGMCPPGGCEPGYKGLECSKECEDGEYGDNCRNTCGHCSSGQLTCDHSNGTCKDGCEPGYKIDKCSEVCDSGKFGRHCTNTCGSCLNGAACHHINGTCLTGCDPGKKGDDCKTDCSPGEYGPNCENKCGNCEHGTLACNRTDGSCPNGCLAGWQAPQCKNVCQHGWYGQNCAEKCGNCRNGHTCNNTIGTCEDGCSPGWKDSMCKQECSARWYGNACQEKCGNCAGGRNCHHVHGTCPEDGESHRCDPGMKGDKCKTDCSNTEYGPDCSQVCGRCFNSSCESVSGNCTGGCLYGWTGIQCVEELIAPEPTIPSAVIATACIVGTILLLVVLVVVLVVVIKKRRLHQQHPRKDASKNLEIGVMYENMAADTHMDTEPNEGDQRMYDIVAADTHMVSELNHNSQMMYENVGNVSRSVQPQSGVMTQNLLHEIARKEESNEFEKDFKDLPAGCQFPCEEATKAANKAKNRYKTTFPYDHSRVQLSGSQRYINANFIKNLEKTNAYVATQGPKANTIGDFWKMVWQLETGRIVMLAQCVEQGKPKVEKYWPDSGDSIEQGGMKISFISSKQCAAFVVRKFRIENKYADETRVISQFHFTKWPDHGTPDVMHFALLLLHVNSTNSKMSGPMIVHCSAGVGRTGTFIALDVLFKNGKLTGRVDPPSYVQSMREDRMDMVQTKSQYVFIYRALVELFFIDNTYLDINDFSSECLNPSHLRREYKRLNAERPTIPKDQLSDGLMQKNQSKNRDQNILPGRLHRPLLSSHPANKTNYINAVFLPSVQNYEGYIATQWPLLETADDFWAMIYDYHTTVIVILDSDTDVNDPDLLPSQEDSEVTAGNFYVQASSGPCTEGSVSIAEVYLSKVGDDSSYKIKIFRMCDWPHDDEQTCEEGSVMRMVYASQECRRNTSTSGPITVVCRNGSSKCGIFCTVANAIENINLNQRTSLIQVVRQLQLRRPSFIGTYESYVICNREVKAHFDSLSEYQNYEQPSTN